MDPISDISYIDIDVKDPVQMFQQILDLYDTNPHKTFPIPLNMATIDDEFGALNRTVNYRYLSPDNHVRIVTQKDSRKYANIKKEPRVTLTFYLEIPNAKGDLAQWQVRIFGEAVELSDAELPELWNEETVFAKIRSIICECGKPIEYSELKAAHDKLLKAYENGEPLVQPKIYTAFKIVPTIWDFYKSDPNCIGDRIQYRKNASGGEEWNRMHVAA